MPEVSAFGIFAEEGWIVLMSPKFPAFLIA